MTLNDAIDHCKEVAETNDCKPCAKDHIQLMKWLQELVKYRQEFGDIHSYVGDGNDFLFEPSEFFNE